MTVNQLVVFAILMEGSGGILDKAPLYIGEKAEACTDNPDPQGLLDSGNYAKYLQWLEIWEIQEDKTIA